MNKNKVEKKVEVQDVRLVEYMWTSVGDWMKGVEE